MKKNFLRVLALMMTLCLVLCLAPAAMAAASFSNDFTKNKVNNDGQVVIERGKEAVVLETKVNSTQSGKMTLTVLNYTNKKAIVKTESRNVNAGDTVKWKLAFDEGLPKAEHNIAHYVMRVEMDGKKLEYSVYLTYDKSKDVITCEKGTWYSNNTACVQGLTLRDMKNPITDKWYTVLPLDLTKQGTQEFNYIASNIYIIGKVTVTVNGDDVVVTYHNNYEAAGGNTQTLSEYMNIYHNIKQVKKVDPEQIGSGYRFGQHISIQNDLGGDTNVLLYVLNRVTYCNYVLGYKKLTRYWPNLQENIALRNQWQQLMDSDDGTLPNQG